MSKLEMAALEDIAEDVTVSHVGPTSEFFRESGIPFLRTGNVGSGRLNLKDIRYVTKEFHLKNKKSALKAGDVLVTRVISNEVNCGVVPDEFGEANCGNVILIRPGARLVSAYLVHLIRNPNVQRALIQRRVGSAQSVVNTSVLKAWKIPVISTVEQKRIAEILDRAEELRSKRREAIAQLDTLTQAIFLEMFGDPATNPKGWTVSKLGDIAEKITDGEHQTPKRTLQGIKLLSARNVQNGYIDVRDVDYVSIEEYERIMKRCNPVRGDILLSCSGTIGRVTTVDTDEPFSLVRSVALLKLKHDLINSKFLEYFLRTPALHAKMQQRANASSQANLFQNQIRELPAFIPPLTLQKEFSHRVEAVEKLKASHRASLSELDTLFASLQHRAFRGEL